MTTRDIPGEGRSPAGMPDAGISVIIPVHNNEDTIVAALDSVRRQTLAPLEIILINDGSSDGSLDRITAYGREHPRILVCSQENTGPAIARNRGVALARGDRIAFLDADDYWYPFHLENLDSILKRHPDLRWASAAFDKEINSTVITERVRLPVRSEVLESYLAAIRYGHPANTNTVLIHRSTFLEAGGFRSDWHVSEDTNLWFRLGIHHPCLGYSPVPSSRYCSSPSSVSLRMRKEHKILPLKLRSLDAALTYAREAGAMGRPDVQIYLGNQLNNLLKIALQDSRSEMRAILRDYRRDIPHFAMHWKTLAYYCLSFLPWISPSSIPVMAKTLLHRGGKGRT